MTTDHARLRAELLSFFTKRLPNPEDAEELTQTVYLRALEGSKGSDRALLFHIARGLLVDEYRRASRETERMRGASPRDYNQFEERPFQGADDRARLLDRNASDEDWDAPTYDFEDSVFAGEFDEAVRGLDDDLRDAFILGELRGLPSREAGLVLGVSRTTANARRELAAARVREEITNVR